VCVCVGLIIRSVRVVFVVGLNLNELKCVKPELNPFNKGVEHCNPEPDHKLNKLT